ncbi:MAG: hypothetical protein KGL12_16890 [Rhodospirillales bacterium]|nr:hypothetical protein [Rhodospirillales bacterium]
MPPAPPERRRSGGHTRARGGSGRRHARAPRRLRFWLILLAVLGVLGLGAFGAVSASVLLSLGRAPRIFAPYIEKRTSGHNPLIVAAGKQAAAWLHAVDRLPMRADLPWPDWVGASAARIARADPAHIRQVASVAELTQAVGSANPGDVIELLPGTYRLTGYGLRITRPGSAAAPITLEAHRLGDAVIEASAVEAIKLSAPYWHIENLEMHGDCGTDDTDCDNAIHVVGAARGTVLRNLRLMDFNAQIKVNGENGAFSDDGVIEDSTLIDTHPRETANPVTPVDIDAASGWRITANLIADFVKAGGDQTSYGGYAKADSQGTEFHRNVVLCAWHLKNHPGARIGLSFGGGGSGIPYRRDLGHTGFEHRDGRISDNLIAFCSDAGIYLNRAAHARVSHNTLLDTAGIDVRYPESSAEINDNIVDGPVHARQGAVLSGAGNRIPFLLGLFLGLHPERRLFVDPARLDLRWRAAPPRNVPGRIGQRDLCGTVRRGPAPPGAFGNFAACLKQGVQAGGG